MPEPDLHAFHQMLADLHQPGHGVQDTLAAIVGLACEALHNEHAGVMLVHDDGPVESVEVSDELVTRGDDLQRSLREGPYLSVIEDPAHVELVPRTVDELAPSRSFVDSRSTTASPVRLDLTGDTGNTRSFV